MISEVFSYFVSIVLLNLDYTFLGWTLNGAIQSYIDVYLTQDTFTEVQRSFPYLVFKEFASGGGDVCLVSNSWRINPF